ncbi:LamG-like jellyroll fold domain-containing protein [Planctomycetota bacterium]
MKWLDCAEIRLVLVVFVAAVVLGGGSAYADFTFSTPIELGQPIWSPGHDPQGCCFSRDGLELYFSSTRPGGYGYFDIWVATRETEGAPWGEPVNLGPNVNSPAGEVEPAISPDGLELYFGLYTDYIIRVCSRPAKDAPWSTPEVLGPPVGANTDYSAEVSPDGLSLYFSSGRPGGYGGRDIWVTTRATTQDDWGTPVNLGLTVNSTSYDAYPSISSDGLALFFTSDRPGGYGDRDIWVTIRPTTGAEWGPPINYPSLNQAREDWDPAISPDGSVLYFESIHNMWQSSITPTVDLNVDGIVDSADMCIMVDHWGENYPLCDIGPTPLGDGVVDIQDLIVLAEHLFEATLVAHWALDETEGMFAADSAGDNDAFVVGGTAWQPSSGRVDGALQLDGVDGCVIAGPVLNPADGPFSIFAWVNGGAPGQVVVSQLGAANWLAADAEGNLMTELTGPGLSDLSEKGRRRTVITDGEWHRIGFVWNGTRRTLYVDGVVLAEDTQDSLEGSQMGLYIGVGKNYTPGTFFSGMIDDVRIYDVALTPKQIAALAQ